MAGSEVTVTFSGPLFEGNSQAIAISILKAGQKAVNETAQAMVDEAKDTYMKNRKSDNPRSFIFDSFGFINATPIATEIKAIVFAGGPTGDQPEYAKYILGGHWTKDRREFVKNPAMDYAYKKGNEIFKSNVEKALKSIGGIIA